MNAALSFEATNDILGSVKIPATPAVFMELHELMQKDEPDIDEVSAAISKDMGLAALVLKTVNSPFFGLRVKAKSIRQATTLLGLLNISNIVVGLALRTAMEDSAAPTPEHYRDSPVNIGMVSAKLSRQFAGVSPDEAYMLGLFHNAGVPLMMMRFDDYLKTISDVEASMVDVTRLEDERYKTNHAVIGYFVCRSWGLPEHVGELILRHHDVIEVLAENGGAMSKTGISLAVLKMAEHIDRRYWGKTDDPEWDRWGEQVLAYAGISSTDFEDIVEDMTELLAAG